MIAQIRLTINEVHIAVVLALSLVLVLSSAKEISSRDNLPFSRESKLAAKPLTEATIASIFPSNLPIALENSFES